MIRILIADDHAVVREGIKRIIADTGDMTVAGEAASWRQKIETLPYLWPIFCLAVLVMGGIYSMAGCKKGG